jgi:hypothetical protein
MYRNQVVNTEPRADTEKLNYIDHAYNQIVLRNNKYLVI